jgi:phosphatidate phosphatase PAH1
VTSRPIGLASHTRKFLANLRQGEAGLPDGPMLGFGGNVPQLLIMELVSMSTHRFKAEMLWKQVVQPFRKVVNASSSTPIFLAGLGNTLMDVQAYHMAGIEMDKIYLINKKSRISAFDKKVDKEWKNMTSSSGRLLSPAVGTAMPRRWYKTKMRSSFEGYSDPRLLSRVMPQQNISEYSGEVGLT